MLKHLYRKTVGLVVIFIGFSMGYVRSNELTRIDWIPHIASSEAWETQLVVDNLSDTEEEINLEIFGSTQMSTLYKIGARSQLIISLDSGECGRALYTSPDLVFREAFTSVSERGVAEFILKGEAFSTLHFPLTQNALDWVGLAVMNTHDQAAKVIFVAIDKSGQVLGSATRSIPALSRDVFELSKAFPDIDMSQLVRVSAFARVPLSGIVIAGIDANRILLFTHGVGEMPGGLYRMPHITKDPLWDTQLLLDNTSNRTLRPVITLNNEMGTSTSKTVEIQPGAQYIVPLSDQDPDNYSTAGILNIDEDGLIARLSYTHLEDRGAAEFVLSTRASTQIVHCLPDYASSELTWMGIAVFNSSEQATALNILGYSEGELQASLSMNLSGYEHFVSTLDTLFDSMQVSHITHLEVISDTDLSGIDISGSGNEQLLFSPAVSPVEEDPGQEVDQLYFPGTNGSWQRQSPSELGWNETLLDAAMLLAEQNQSSGIVMLHNGKILLERYWSPNGVNRLGQTEFGFPMEDVASVQKSVSSLLATMARDRGLLDIEQPVSLYLGEGWSHASPEQEEAILVRHLLSMTSGLSTSFYYRHPAGTNWQYNTEVYAMTHPVLEAATQMSLPEIMRKWLGEPLALENTSWRYRGDASSNPNGLVTSGRDMARIGLMVLAQGSWSGETLIENTQLLKESVQPSQDLNRDYGFLWWLNRQGTLIPTAPTDLTAAQGAGGRRIYVVPSMGLVVTRTGDNPSGSFYREFWDLIVQAAP